jgi:hypothetical protein
MPAFVSQANRIQQEAAGQQRSQGYNHPLDASVDESVQAYLESGTDISVAIFVLFGLSFLPASVLVFLVKERVSKVSGSCPPPPLP